MSESAMSVMPVGSATPIAAAPAQQAAVIAPAPAQGAAAGKSFLGHAKVIGLLTLVSRVMGLGREIVAGHYLGTGLVASAFTVAFTVPNLFRKLFGEGALSAAFIPLYAQALKGEREPGTANDFATASVNLLCVILLGITLVGELAIGSVILFGHHIWPDLMLTLKFTAIMLPYVLLICGGAFLSGILQVHKRFAAPAAAPIILNVCHILVLMIGAWAVGLHATTPKDQVVAKQTTLAYGLAFVVLVAGAMQVMVLLPSLRATGFRFRPVLHFWTPMVRRMLKLMVPVAVGAGVLQLSVLLDKGISMALMQRLDSAGQLITHFTLFGHWIRFPMELGAPRRLDMAQFLYQFPLGVFAIALATAIFPGLSADALDKDRARFRSTLRHGIEATFWEGLPASIGLILVREPAIRLLFQHGQIDGHSAMLIGRSVLYYAGAIWAFSLLQIINRAYYALHDTKTPLALALAVINILINLVVELPLIWVRGLGESGMAVGTLVSFGIQAIVMLIMLDRRIGGLELSRSAKPVGKMLLATIVMALACWGLQHSPLYPGGYGRIAWAAQLAMLLSLGAGVYFGACYVMGVGVMTDLLPRRFRGKGGVVG